MTSTCKAVVCVAAGRAEVQAVPVPQVGRDTILVRVKAVALNPTDWKSIANEENVGLRIGCDYAGVVEEVGAEVTKPFNKGDRVCGFLWGASSTVTGAFGEYSLAVPDLQIKMPDNLSFEEAATLGVGITTVAQGLYQSLKLPLPASPLASPEPILIWGGSTATGILGIQYAKLSGLAVITTSSPRNFEYLESLGADATLDYRAAADDPDALAADIRALAGGGRIARAWDCSPTAGSARACALAMGGGEGEGEGEGEGAKYSSILPVDPGVLRAANPGVESEWTLAYTAFGEAFGRGGRALEARPGDRAFAARFWEASRELLADGRIKAARLALDRGGGGLEGVLRGLEDLRQGKVSGTKLVYRI